jgi:heptosyltransferase-2
MNEGSVILIARGGLGDTVRFLSALSVIRSRYAGRRIIAIARDAAQKEIIESAAVSDETVIYDPRLLSWAERIAFLRHLRRSRPGLLIATYGNVGWWTRILSWLSRVPVRVGYAPRPYFTHPLVFDPTRSRWDLELDILRALKIPLPDPWPPPEFRITEEVRRKNDDLLRARGIGPGTILVGTHIGLNTVSHGKCWPVGRWRELMLALLRDHPGLRFLVLGGGDEAAVRREIAALSFPPQALDLVGCTGFAHTADLVRRCRVFITNDSFLLHLAGVYRVPQVALFGPTSEKVALPAHYRAIVIAGDCPSRPCYRIGPPGAKNYACEDYRCMEEITVERVRKAAEELLQESWSGNR